MQINSSYWFVLIGLSAVFSCPASAQNGQTIEHAVSARQPVQHPSLEQGADRPRVAPQATRLRKQTAAQAVATNPWLLLASLPGAVVHDISFPTATVGFAAAELGQVWKTTDGGLTWTEIMNLGIPYYWYGVHAFDTNDVIISGFIDTSTTTGVARWSHDGGQSWTGDIVLGSTSSERPRFASSNQGLILDLIASGHYTTGGGATAADWTQVTVDPSGGWFGSEFSLLPDGHAVASGINYCTSSDAGATWTCKPSIDSLYDGPIFFFDDNHGWVGGGQISPTVEGWIHRTTDGGTTWSGRVLDGPLPIREILFLSPSMGWAAGGNIYSNVGGIYFSADGGQTWSLDVDTSGFEMDACDTQPAGSGYQVWCAGYNGACSSYGNPSCAGTVYRVQGADTPVLTPAPQSYTAAQSISLTDSTAGATIHYSTDGSAPTTVSPVYTSPIAVSSTTTLQAIAVSPNTAPSLIAGGLYTITPILHFQGNAPSLTVNAGGSGTVQLSLAATANATNVSFSCSGLPTGAQCSFSPSSVNAGTTPTNVTLTIAASRLATAGRSSGLQLTLAMMLAGVLLPRPLRPRRHAQRRRSAVCIGFLLALALTLAGCGSNSAPPVHASVTVTASETGATSATTQVQLTITH